MPHTDGPHKALERHLSNIFHRTLQGDSIIRACRTVAEKLLNPQKFEKEQPMKGIWEKITYPFVKLEEAMNRQVRKISPAAQKKFVRAKAPTLIVYGVAGIVV